MKMSKKFFATLLAAAVAVTTLVAPATEVSAYQGASYTPYTYTEDGIAYTSNVDANGIEIPANIRMFYKFDEDIVSGVRIDLPEGATLLSAKSSSKKKLAVNIYRNAVDTPAAYTSTWNYVDGTTSTYSNPEAKYSQTDAYLGMYAKKTGDAKITVKIQLKDGTVVTKTIKVKIVKDGAAYTATYSGTTFDEDGYVKTVAKSGKIKVKAGKGFKINKIEFANKFDANGDPIYKTIKNNKKVTLNTKKAVTRSEVSNTYKYSDGDVQTYSYKLANAYKYNFIYAASYVRVSYTDKFLGVTYDVKDANDDNGYADVYAIYKIK